ncbi:MAG: hypothetical protein BWX71_01800 [Deltaproteobacteria bacterium ADurb.Bin072]|nr:MAG: hypothetical protein BWX71_01800 [Deltaproteobacteria bacterium ADurb.Bin072]
MVPGSFASRDQSRNPDSLAGSSWAVTKVTEAAMPRWVGGMPAATGPAVAEEMPGTISKGMPFSCR